jgi:hypothetical protein
MSDLSQTKAPGGRTLPGGSVDRLATRALSCVARRQQTSGPVVIAARQAQLLEAVVSSDPAAVQAAVRDMMRAGIAPDVIADRYVPEVARRLGEMWCSDETGFAVVTIGAARLQGLLRVLEGMAGPQRRAAGGGVSLLVIVPEGIHHTLGAMVLTGQMRRCGAPVAGRRGRGGFGDGGAGAVRCRDDLGPAGNAGGGGATDRAGGQDGGSPPACRDRGDTA